MLLLVGLLLAVAATTWLVRSRAPARKAAGATAQTNLLGALMALEAREAEADRTVWATERLAQRCGRVFEDLWDNLNQATNRLAALAAFDAGMVVMPAFGAPAELPHGIRRFAPGETPRGPELGGNAWKAWLAARAAEGWELNQVEFRHNRFSVDDAGRPAESLFGVRAHLTRERGAGAAGEERRAALEGDLRVVWSPAPNDEEPPAIRFTDASRLTLKTRVGALAFVETLTAVVRPPERSHFIDPLVLHDLEGDGRPEILLLSANRVWHWQPEGGWETRSLCRQPPGLIFTGTLADFDQDGTADLLVAKFEGLYLTRGPASGAFDETARLVWKAPERVRYGQVLTGGDVDGDGDLDVWFGQYKNPYDNGQMPTPFYDANDGNPSYLLLNDGRGNFTDATAPAGLAAKRWRRTYSASLVDLDTDGDLDLAVVSDFAGVDLYANDGRGRFKEVTSTWLQNPKAFGMAHTFADFNVDGRLDLFVTGMHCPTASRLVGLGLQRPERPDYLEMTPRMIQGNKLLLGQANGSLEDVAAQAGVARTGWSWGCAAVDFDNDGWPDLAIANGHETRQSVREYEPEFWLHDLYAADSRESPVTAQHFAAKINRLRGGGMSYGGWEQNRLFLNRGAAGFVEVAHLLGVARAEDSRNLATADLDGDGRQDLVLTTFEVWPVARQTLRVFRNALPKVGNWLAVRFEAGQGTTPTGAKVTLRLADGNTTVRHVVTGDSHRSQHAPQVHFGLGAATNVVAVEVQWPGGQTSVLNQPAINRAHIVAPGNAKPAAY